jgi:hypothetical protein
LRLDPSEKNIFDWGNELLLRKAVEPATEVFKRGVALYPKSFRMFVGLGHGRGQDVCATTGETPALRQSTKPPPFLAFSGAYC